MFEEEAITTDYLADNSAERAMARRVFQTMLTSRLLETKLSSLYKAGQIVGGVYLGKGQEAVSASLGCALIPGTDVFAPLIRDQAGRTGFGEPLLDCIRTYLGSSLGPMRGRDGNIHRGRPSEGYLAMISHLGTAVSVVSGVLFARRMAGNLEGVVGATCIGDGGTSTGAFHEGLNMAAVEKLPLVVVVADNQFAYSTPNTKQYACDTLLDRALGYGVVGHEVDGTNMLQTIRVMNEAVDLARQGAGPQMVVAKLLRLSGHGEHDDGSYVPKSLRECPLGNDCIEIGRLQMLQSEFAREEEMNLWEEEAMEEIQKAVALVQREPGPDPYTESWQALATGGFGMGEEGPND